eukprot:1003003-Pyramimonas_sp.AAC.3
MACVLLLLLLRMLLLAVVLRVDGAVVVVVDGALSVGVVGVVVVGDIVAVVVVVVVVVGVVVVVWCRRTSDQPRGLPAAHPRPAAEANVRSTVSRAGAGGDDLAWGICCISRAPLASMRADNVQHATSAC